MARVGIESFGERIEVSTDRGPVFVDCTGSDLVVAAPDGTTLELGAFTPGVARVLSLVEEMNEGARLLLEEREALFGALLAALRRASTRRGPRAPVVERQLESLGRSAIYFSFPFLSAHHLRADVARERAARIALHRVDLELPINDDARTASREAALAALEDVFRWRALYAEAGTSRKVINKVLATYGDKASAEALWGLRSVRLAALPESVEKLELLGHLGAHPRAGDLVTHMELVGRAGPGEVARALALPQLVDFSRGHAITGFAHLLSTLPIEDDWTFARAVREACDRTFVTLPGSTTTALPPIPLPVIEGLRFLASVDAIRDEAARMQHCVASYTLEAVAGRCFLFHAATALGHATVMLDDKGALVQAYGPKNTRNDVAAWAAVRLTEWGRGFVFAELGFDTPTWRSSDVAVVEGAPLRTVRSCFEAYRTMTALRADRSGELTAWFDAWMRAAARGDVGLVREDVLGMPTVRAVDARGVIRSSTTSIQGRGLTVLPSTPRRSARARRGA